MIKKCVQCGSKFEALRSSKTCSPLCSVKNHRKKSALSVARCRANYSEQKREQKREQARLYAAKTRADSPEKYRQKARDWYADNPEKCRQRSAIYRMLSPEKVACENARTCMRRQAAVKIIKIIAPKAFKKGLPRVPQALKILRSLNVQPREIMPW